MRAMEKKEKRRFIVGSGACIAKFIPEPTVGPSTDVKRRKKDGDEGGKDMMKKRRKQVLFSGIVTAIGISLHNFPEVMAVFLGSIKVRIKYMMNRKFQGECTLTNDLCFSILSDDLLINILIAIFVCWILLHRACELVLI